MSIQAETVHVVVSEIINDCKKVEMTTLRASSSSHSSTSVASLHGNNVSFVNITYTIQPKPFMARFKKIPTKKILNDVR